jgi:4-hydroxy-3-methylbut-2-enyl diphosphate reductase IspH
MTVRLAREFGFATGWVERAGGQYVSDAHQISRIVVIFLAGEIHSQLHVPRLREMGVAFLAAERQGFDHTTVRAEDVVILPAFGVPTRIF